MISVIVSRNLKIVPRWPYLEDSKARPYQAWKMAKEFSTSKKAVFTMANGETIKWMAMDVCCIQMERKPTKVNG